MEEGAWSREHGGGSMEEGAWRREEGGGRTEGGAWRSDKGEEVAGERVGRGERGRGGHELTLTLAERMSVRHHDAPS